MRLFGSAPSINRQLIHSVAGELIKDIQSPPVPIYEITRKVVPMVFTVEKCAKDAFCLRSRAGEYRIFVCLDGNTPERVRFSTAHELGHVVLKHHTRLENAARRIKIKVPRNFLLIWSEIPELARLVQFADEEADAFAAEILMPLKWLCRPKTLREFESLRKRLFVSRPSLKRRLVETRIMSWDELEVLFKRVNGRDQKKAGA